MNIQPFQPGENEDKFFTQLIHFSSFASTQSSNPRRLHESIVCRQYDRDRCRLDEDGLLQLDIFHMQLKVGNLLFEDCNLLLQVIGPLEIALKFRKLHLKDFSLLLEDTF